MNNEQPINENNLPGDEKKSPEQAASSNEDGRLNEWQDRGRVALDHDLAPDAHTNPERDFEPENIRKEKPKDDRVY